MNIIKKIVITSVSLFLLQACNDNDNDDVVETPTPPVEMTSIVDAAVANGGFTTLVAALQATGLDATLDDTSKSYTVFAPTDAAFALLGQKTIDALLADTDTLSNILLYHVLSSEVNAAAAIASAGTTVETANGDSVGLSLSGEMLLVNTATVTMTDIETDNGIIHVIDAVLLPPAMAEEMPTMNIVETAIAAGNFTTLVATLQATGLDAALADPESSFTVFAPTDAAFAAINAATISSLLENTDTLSSILLQHVVEGEVPAVTAFSLNGQSAQTLSEVMLELFIDPKNDTLNIAGATITSTDIKTSNGIIHVIDTVIIDQVALPEPESTIVDIAVAAGTFDTLVAALQATELDSVLANADGNFTVFAPTDEAFALLGADTIAALLADTDTLSNILLYHVISGASVLQDGALNLAKSDMPMATMANEQMATVSLSDSQLYVNKSAVSSTNIMANNGVIHVLDQVILPPAMAADSSMTIADVAAADERFTTLVSALTAANLVGTLDDENAQFTVFAPTNDAFAKIDSSVLESLLADTIALTNILLTHVVSGAQVNSLSAFGALNTDIETASEDSISLNLVNFIQTMNGDNDEVAYNSMYQQLVGGMNSDHAGNTLYVFDGDLGTSTSTCNSDCAINWPPVLVSDGEVDNIPGLGMITRDDNTMQATYLGRPLYFYVGDTNAGDMTGQGLNDMWWVVEQEQVSLQVNGSNITTTDIYTANGIIHVIDTVITD
ncbi:fasciclin domain-containing protein [Thalassotalea sp. PLHSN55]|uniref:fasciclin domain-containing protein n=1 Tax=Thalassotalea sp. PLHSN55 TaxID=3435888 RepID=UPI003F84619D